MSTCSGSTHLYENSRPTAFPIFLTLTPFTSSPFPFPSSPFPRGSIPAYTKVMLLLGVFLAQPHPQSCFIIYMEHALNHATHDIALGTEPSSTSSNSTNKEEKKNVFSLSNQVDVVNLFLNFIEEWLGSYVSAPTVESPAHEPKNIFHDEVEDIVMVVDEKHSDVNNTKMMSNDNGHWNSKSNSVKLVTSRCQTCTYASNQFIFQYLCLDSFSL